MNQDWFALLSESAGYWFSFLAVIVVWRAIRWLRMEARQRKKVLRSLPDAGFIGTLYVLEGESRFLHPDSAVPLPIEGVMGSASGCDARIAHPSVAGRHALFELQGDGLHLRPYREEILQVDGEPMPLGCEAILQHGATITLGGVVLQLRLFAGVQLEQAEEEDVRAVAPPPKKRRAPQKDPAEAEGKEQTQLSMRPVSGDTRPFSVLQMREGNFEAYVEEPASIQKPKRRAGAAEPKTARKGKPVPEKPARGQRAKAHDDNPIFGDLDEPRR